MWCWHIKLVRNAQQDAIIWRFHHMCATEINKLKCIDNCCCCSVTQSCSSLCDPMDCSTPGFPVLHHLPEFDQTPVHWVGDAIQPSHPGSVPFSSYFQSFPASESFPVSQLFTSGGQSIGASASTSVLPIHIQDWFPLGLTGLISLLSKGISNVFSNTTVRKHQFFGTQTSLWSNSDPIMYIRTRSPNSPHSCWHLL